MPDKFRTRERYGEVFWRKHHEAWQQSALNQREYCEAHGIPLKAFGNWRAKFKAEPQLPTPKLLYRRRGLSHTLSHRLSHSLSHMTNDLPGPIVPLPTAAAPDGQPSAPSSPPPSSTRSSPSPISTTYWNACL